MVLVGLNQLNRWYCTDWLGVPRALFVSGVGVCGVFRSLGQVLIPGFGGLWEEG